INSFALMYPHTNYFECELAENYGLRFENHPWVRPVRKQDTVYGKNYEFFKMEGEEVHEVAVGPVHAGVIEPGHFRFQCHGELVYNLEINLGYQHRGVEDLFIKYKINKHIQLAESIAGDTTIGHTLTNCMAIESLSNTKIPYRAEVIRGIAAELERIAMHLSGLIGLANDVGFALPSSSYGRIRTLVINSLAALCGNRFGRGLLIYGGVRFDFTNEILDKVKKDLSIVWNDVSKINEYLFSSIGALARFEETGVVSTKLATDVALVGPAGRSCGLEEDTRVHFPYCVYRFSPIPIITLSSGDVFARAKIRALEIEESFKFVFDLLDNLPSGNVNSAVGLILPNSGVVSVTEGWRGEIVHVVFTNNNSSFCNYKIKDPSFNNWYGLSLALRKTAISDFPLCNKSFDLSYAGHDL
ncbi:MAG TPA: hypothetical protein PL041_10280, partial [Melioribacteraceae bacterium]|nr:hypothetical protein [Melioribacteraceae bacterium]